MIERDGLLPPTQVSPPPPPLSQDAISMHPLTCPSHTVHYITLSYQHTVPCQHALSNHLLKPPLQPTLSTHAINPRYQQVIAILGTNPSLPLYVASRFVANIHQGLSSEVNDLRGRVDSMQRTLCDMSTQPSRDANPATTTTATTTTRNRSRSSSAAAAANASSVETEKRKWEAIKSSLLQVMEINRIHPPCKSPYQSTLSTHCTYTHYQQTLENTPSHPWQADVDEERFFAELEHSKDGFTTIASYYGKLAL